MSSRIHRMSKLEMSLMDNIKCLFMPYNFPFIRFNLYNSTDPQFPDNFSEMIIWFHMSFSFLIKIFFVSVSLQFIPAFTVFFIGFLGHQLTSSLNLFFIFFHKWYKIVSSLLQPLCRLD